MDCKQGIRVLIHRSRMISWCDMAFIFLGLRFSIREKPFFKEIIKAEEDCGTVLCLIVCFFART